MCSIFDRPLINYPKISIEYHHIKIIKILKYSCSIYYLDTTNSYMYSVSCFDRINLLSTFPFIVELKENSNVLYMLTFPQINSQINGI